MYLLALKHEEILRLHFWSLNDMKEGTNNAFSGMKLTTKL